MTSSRKTTVSAIRSGSLTSRLILPASRNCSAKCLPCILPTAITVPPPPPWSVRRKPDRTRLIKGTRSITTLWLSVSPANQLTIIDYNRVVKDLNGLSEEEFLAKLEKNFVVEEKGADIYKPAALHNFSLYLAGKWYSLTAKQGTYNDNDPIGVLDVTISFQPDFR